VLRNDERASSHIGAGFSRATSVGDHAQGETELSAEELPASSSVKARETDPSCACPRPDRGRRQVFSREQGRARPGINEMVRVYLAQK
jgi:hypothetical protein